MTKTLTELTNIASSAGWIPTEQFADLILEAAVCYGQLSGVVTAVDYDLSAGQGDTVNVRYVPARTAQKIADCGCAAAASTTLAAYTIDIDKVMDVDKICGMGLFEAGDKVKGSIINEMAKGLAAYRDQYVWYAIRTFIPAAGQYAVTGVGALSTATMSAYCCGYKYDLYNSIVSLKQYMRGKCYNPDYVIMHPTVARWFYIKDWQQSSAGLVKFSEDGSKILSVAGLKVIESGQATAANSTAKATMAVIIDSSRAVGEAWGKRPMFTEAYDVLCDTYTEAVVMYWGYAKMDAGAIGHIVNP
jgi:hypothetical protein